MGDSQLKLLETYCPLPETKRGYGFHMYAASLKDGDWFLYTSGRHVIIRSLSDPRISRVFSEHKAKANVAAFSPNGEWIASGDDHGRVLVWGVKNFNIKNDVQACGQVLDITWDPEGKRICAVGNGKDTFSKVFSWDSGNNLGGITGHAKMILTCAYKPTRPYRVLTGSEDLSVGFHIGPPFKFDHSVKEHSRYPNKILFSPDGETAISVGADAKILVFDGKSGERIRELEDKDQGHKSAIYSFAWSPDSKAILTCAADKTAKLWDVEKGAVIKTFTFSHKPTVNDMQMSCLWHKDYVITCSLSGALNFLDLNNPDKPKLILHGHKSPIQTFSMDRASRTFFTGDLDGQICMWHDGRARWIEGSTNMAGIRGVAVAAGGALLYTVASDDALRLSEVKSGTLNPEGAELGGTPACIAASHKGVFAVVGLEQNKLVLFEGDKLIATLSVGYKPYCIQFSPDDSEVAVGGEDKKAHFYAFTGKELKETKVVTDHVLTVTAIRYTDAVVSTSSKDKGLLVFKDGAIVNPSHWEFHASGITDHRWSPSGTRCASVANDLTIFVWLDAVKFSTERKEEKMSHRDGIGYVEFFDDDTLLTIGEEGAIKIWGI